MAILLSANNSIYYKEYNAIFITIKNIQPILRGRSNLMNSELIKKAKHYINRSQYKRSHRMLPDINGGYAACGQDILIHELLNQKSGGVFVDIGANDGVTISNSYYFESEFGWSGLAIEPIPKIYQTLKQNRKCICVNGCITPSSGSAKFMEVVGAPNMLSTLALNNDGLTARRLRKNVKRHNARLNIIDVECFNINQLLQIHGLESIDFLSVDTEGGELEILKSFDFEKHPVQVISVENNYFSNQTRSYLESLGFLYIGTFKVDEIYLYGGSELRSAV